MRVFFYAALTGIVVIAIFAVQNSNAPPVMIRFLLWKFETSLTYTILGSMLLGILLAAFLCIPRVLRGSFQKKPVSFKDGGT